MQTIEKSLNKPIVKVGTEDFDVMEKASRDLAFYTVQFKADFEPISDSQVSVEELDTHAMLHYISSHVTRSCSLMEKSRIACARLQICVPWSPNVKRWDMGYRRMYELLIWCEERVEGKVQDAK